MTKLADYCVTMPACAAPLTFKAAQFDGCYRSVMFA